MCDCGFKQKTCCAQLQVCVRTFDEQHLAWREFFCGMCMPFARLCAKLFYRSKLAAMTVLETADLEVEGDSALARPGLAMSSSGTPLLEGLCRCATRSGCSKGKTHDDRCVKLCTNRLDAECRIPDCAGREASPEITEDRLRGEEPSRRPGV